MEKEPCDAAFGGRKRRDRWTHQRDRNSQEGSREPSDVTGVEMPRVVTLGVRMCSITDNQNGGDVEREARCDV